MAKLSRTHISKLFILLSSWTFIFTVIFLIYFFITSFDFNFIEIKNRYLIVFNFLVSTGAILFIKKFLRYSSIRLNIFLIFISVILWVLFFPIHYIKFSIIPDDTSIYLYNNKVNKKVYGLCAKHYIFRFQSPRYRTDSLSVSYWDVLFNKTINVKLQHLYGSLIIEPNTNNITFRIKPIGETLYNDYGTVTRIDSLLYGDYILFGEKGSDFEQNSIRVTISKSINNLKFSLKKLPKKYHSIEVITKSNTKIYLHEVNEVNLLGTTNKFGISNIYLPEGNFNLILKHGNTMHVESTKIPLQTGNRISISF